LSCRADTEELAVSLYALLRKIWPRKLRLTTRWRWSTCPSLTRMTRPLLSTTSNGFVYQPIHSVLFSSRLISVIVEYLLCD